MSNQTVGSQNRNPNTERLRKLREAIAQKEVDALLISQPENLRYLSGFAGSGWLLVSKQDTILAVDFLYEEQAKIESPGYEIIRPKQELHDWLPSLASNLGWHKLGFEANLVSYDTYLKLSAAIRTTQINLELVPASGIVEQLRSVKGPEELVLIAKAAGLADTAFEQAKKMIRPGITEKEIAWQIETILRQKGSEGVPFEIIVASGANAALPHARPTDKTIRSGEPVLIDMGARINGYCSDLSRTLFPGGPTRPFQKIYNIVLGAQTAAMEGIRSGIDASQADRLARNVVDEAGYGDAFGHGLGHGVGLAIHEFPRLGLSSSDPLVDGMVFTLEPGIYLAGQGGVRIEDMAVLENGRLRVLSKAEK